MSPVFADGGLQWVSFLSNKWATSRIVKNQKWNTHKDQQKDVFTIWDEIDQIVASWSEQNLTNVQFDELKKNIELADGVDWDILAWEYWVFALNAAKNGIEIVPHHEYLNLVAWSRQEYVLEKYLEEYDYLWLIKTLKVWQYDRVITWEEFDILTQKLAQYKLIKKAIQENDYEWFVNAVEDYSKLIG